MSQPESGGSARPHRLGTLAEPEIGTVLTVMAFNIWLGGTLEGRIEGRHDFGWGERNRAQLGAFLRAEDPDVLFVVETYGAGAQIQDALNRHQPAGREFTGVQVTRPEHYGTNGDNLWLFTVLEVEEIYPATDDEALTSFHFGGARLRLPSGGHVHAFCVWLYHADIAWTRTSQTAMEIASGVRRTYSDGQLLATDERARTAMAKAILTERLPAYVDDDAPVVLGGDFNTLSHRDWSSRFAHAPGHEGLVLDWPVMRAFDEAGFTDTYRQANPDVERFPGQTWSPAHAWMYAPTRMDYILIRGETARVLASSTRAQRLPEHRGDALDEQYPFYSDHGAVVTDLLIRDGDEEDPDRLMTFDAPHEPLPRPRPVPGTAIPAERLCATASSTREGHPAANAVDEDPRTCWYSRMLPDPPDPHPHTLTVDLGEPRVLAGVRYQPPIGGFFGIVTRYTLAVSLDGEEFDTVVSATWTRDPLPKDVALDGVTARYLRLEALAGVGGFSAVAQLVPYV